MIAAFYFEIFWISVSQFFEKITNCEILGVSNWAQDEKLKKKINHCPCAFSIKFQTIYYYFKSIEKNQNNIQSINLYKIVIVIIIGNKKSYFLLLEFHICVSIFEIVAWFFVIRKENINWCFFIYSNYSFHDFLYKLIFE